MNAVVLLDQATKSSNYGLLDTARHLPRRSSSLTCISRAKKVAAPPGARTGANRASSGAPRLPSLKTRTRVDDGTSKGNHRAPACCSPGQQGGRLEIMHKHTVPCPAAALVLHGVRRMAPLMVIPHLVTAEPGGSQPGGRAHLKVGRLQREAGRRRCRCRRRLGAPEGKQAA